MYGNPHAGRILSGKPQNTVETTQKERRDMKKIVPLLALAILLLTACQGKAYDDPAPQEDPTPQSAAAEEYDQPAQPPEPTQPAQPAYLADYLGMTVGELAAIWGDDFMYDEGLYQGGAQGLYYQDARVPMLFYYNDTQWVGDDVRQQPIIIVAVWSQEGASMDYMVSENLPFSLTYPQLKEHGVYGELGESYELVDGVECTVYATYEVRATYAWTAQQDPYTDPPVCVELRY